MQSEAESEDEGSDYEEEIVVVELSGVPNPNVVHESKGPCSILGLETTEPVLQLENYVFKGRYEDSPGSCLLFRENAADKELKYECVSIKKLKMSRVVLKRKTGDISSNKQPDNSKETTRQEAIYSSS